MLGSNSWKRKSKARVTYAKNVIQPAHALLAKYVAEMGENKSSGTTSEICHNQKGFSEVVLYKGKLLIYFLFRL